MQPTTYLRAPIAPFSDWMSVSCCAHAQTVWGSVGQCGGLLRMKTGCRLHVIHLQGYVSQSLPQSVRAPPCTFRTYIMPAQRCCLAHTATPFAPAISMPAHPCPRAMACTSTATGWQASILDVCSNRCCKKCFGCRRGRKACSFPRPCTLTLVCAAMPRCSCPTTFPGTGASLATSLTFLTFPLLTLPLPLPATLTPHPPVDHQCLAPRTRSAAGTWDFGAVVA